MTPPGGPCTLEPALVATGSDDESGVIVRVGGRIAAIFVRLDAAWHEADRGRWFLEAGFGACAGAPAPFPRLADAVRWVAGRTGLDPGGLEEAIAEAGRIAGPGRTDEAGQSRDAGRDGPRLYDV